MWDVTNYDMVGAILLENHVDYHSESRVWNGNDSNHIVIVHESYVVPFVFVICSW